MWGWVPRSKPEGQVKQVFSEEGPKVEVALIGVASLWVASAILLTMSTYSNELASEVGRWGLFLTAVSATWTTLIGQARSRRRVVHALRYELQCLRDDEQEPGRMLELI